MAEAVLDRALRPPGGAGPDPPAAPGVPEREWPAVMSSGRTLTQRLPELRDVRDLVRRRRRAKQGRWRFAAPRPRRGQIRWRSHRGDGRSGRSTSSTADRPADHRGGIAGNRARPSGGRWPASGKGGLRATARAHPRDRTAQTDFSTLRPGVPAGRDRICHAISMLRAPGVVGQRSPRPGGKFAGRVHLRTGR